MTYNHKKIDKLILFFIIYTIVIVTFFSTLSYTLPFVLGILSALILRKPAIYLSQKFKIKTWVSSLIVTLIFFAIIITLMSLGVFAITSEMIQLGKNTQNFLNNNYFSLDDFLNKFQDIFKNVDPSLLKLIQNNISSTTSKTLNITAEFIKKIVSGIIALLAKIPYILMVILFTLLSTYFFTRDITKSKGNMFNFIDDKLARILEESKKMLSNYMLSYLLIISISLVETLIGFSILKVKYAVILSIIAAIFDFLPLLGLGSVYIPVAAVYFFTHNYFKAATVLILYVIVSTIRQIIEPKIVSSSLGIHPVAVLAAIFIGLKANGISGMFFCLFLVVFYNILKKVNVL